MKIDKIFGKSILLEKAEIDLPPANEFLDEKPQHDIFIIVERGSDAAVELEKGAHVVLRPGHYDEIYFGDRKLVYATLDEVVAVVGVDEK